MYGSLGIDQKKRGNYKVVSKEDKLVISDDDNDDEPKWISLSTLNIVGTVSLALFIGLVTYFSISYSSYRRNKALISSSSSTSYPNIIFILTDDQGMGDMDIDGGDFENLMPIIRTFSESGLNFTQYYTASLCTPARSSLMTGIYPINNGMQHGVVMSTYPWGLSVNEKLISEYFNEFDYKTYLIGKWHLGHYSKSHLPLARGFDYFFGYYGGYQHPLTYFYEWPGCDNTTGCVPDMHDNREVYPKDGQFNIYTLGDKVESIIYEQSESEPFFLYLPVPLMHMPVHPDQDIMNEYSDRLSSISNIWRRRTAGMAIMLDKFVERIKNALESTNLIDNSILIFASDNGAMPIGDETGAGSNYPLRGAKGSLYEGATRVPAWLYSPLLGHSLNSKGKSYDNMFHVTDWLPTLIGGVLGQNDKLPDYLDGVDHWNYIENNIDDASPRDSFLYNLDTLTGIGAIRVGEWKLLVNESSDVGWFDGDTFGINYCGLDPTQTVQLFNVIDDEQERYDVADDNPTIVAELLDMLNSYYVTASNSLYCSDKDDSAAELWFKLNQIEPWITLDEEVDYDCPTVEGRSGWCALVDSSSVKPPNGPP